MREATIACWLVFENLREKFAVFNTLEDIEKHILALNLVNRKHS